VKNLLEKKGNENDVVFNIPAQEGGSDEDNYLASIGDAVLEHVQSLSSAQRQLWDSLLHMSNTGAIFRIEENPFQRDTDPFNLEKEDNLDAAFKAKVLSNFKGKDIDPEYVRILREEFDKEVERRQKSEDIADVGIPIPYHNWEKFPQMHKHWDIQSTPKPLYIYMGESRSFLYDYIPEHHPDKQRIEQVLNLINKDWDEITEEFAKWAVDLLDQMPFKSNYARTCLQQMIDELATGYWWEGAQLKEPKEVIIRALENIDQVYSQDYQIEAKKTRNKNPIHKLLNINEIAWTQEYKKGNQPYSSIKKFGSLMYAKYLKQTDSSHWIRYKGLKRKFAPIIMFKDLNLNRASICDLKKYLNITDTQARQIWFARPFDNITQLRKNGLLVPEKLTKNFQTQKVLDLIETTLQQALESSKPEILTDLGKTLRNIEIKSLTGIIKEEWQTIWFYYRMCKGEIFNMLNKLERKKQNDVKKG
tara:strand:- start:20245 stop:21669 length:1425 start_codon:yes stop_codon:yes gene_type:complete